MNIGEMLRMTAVRLPEKTALIMDDDSITYGELNRRVNRLAHGFMDIGVKHSDRVAVLTHNSIEYYEIYLALCKIGAIMVPFNHLLKEKELVRDFNYISPKILVTQADFAPMMRKVVPQVPGIEKVVCLGRAESADYLDYDALMEGKSEEEPGVKVDERDIMSIFLTSGTTGKPKGAMRTHRHNYLNALSASVEMSLEEEDKVLLLFPFYHVTFEDRFCHIMRGNTIVLNHEGSFRAPEVLDLLSKHKITICQFVPTMINTMLQEPDIEDYDLSSMRLILYAAAPMPVELLKKALTRFKCGFMQFYGQTETGPMTTVLRPSDHRPDDPSRLERLASCGRPALIFEARLVDHDEKEVPVGEVGELTVRSEAATVGYWNLPGATDQLWAGGWLHTGDYARRDADGFIYIVDRKNDMIISGGKNIYPREVEEVLYGHNAVLEATVIGVPDPHWGESVMAVVVTKPGMSLTSDELIAFCKENMASYKKPKVVEFREALPKSATGKILKRVLRDEMWKDSQRKI